jgi:hypothetical protein
MVLVKTIHRRYHDPHDDASLADTACELGQGWWPARHRPANRLSRRKPKAGRRSPTTWFGNVAGNRTHDMIIMLPLKRTVFGMCVC